MSAEHFEPETRHACEHVDGGPVGMVVVCPECGKTWQAFSANPPLFGYDWWPETRWHRWRRQRFDDRPLLTIREQNARVREAAERLWSTVEMPIHLAPSPAPSHPQEQ